MPAAWARTIPSSRRGSPKRATRPRHSSPHTRSIAGTDSQEDSKSTTTASARAARSAARRRQPISHWRICRTDRRRSRSSSGSITSILTTRTNRPNRFAAAIQGILTAARLRRWITRWAGSSPRSWRQIPMASRLSRRITARAWESTARRSTEIFSTRARCTFRSSLPHPESCRGRTTRLSATAESFTRSSIWPGSRKKAAFVMTKMKSSSARR